MILKTCTGKMYDVDYTTMPSSAGRLHIRISNDVKLSKIAEDFDDLESFEIEGDKGIIYNEGPYALIYALRDDINMRTTITLQKIV